MLGWLIFGAYCVPMIYVARRAYASFRAEEIKQSGLQRYERSDDVVNGVTGFIVGIVWPVALMGLIVKWKPRRSDGELRELADQRWREIESLERELAKYRD